jgi:hypothetical protein
MTTPPVQAPPVTAPATPITPRTKSSLPKLFRTNNLKATYGTVLGYGPAGAGKTRSVKTLKDGGKEPVVIVTELGETSGLLSLASQDIAFIRCTNHTEVMEVIKEMQRKPGKIEYEQTEFGSVVLDSITQWGEFPLDRFVQLKGWTDLHGISEKGDGKDPRQAYGFLAEKGRQLYKELFKMHGHLYILAREGLFGGEGGVAQFAAPELPGQKLPRELPGWPDACVRLRVINGKFRMVTKGEGLTPARVRLPDAFTNLPLRCLPDISALIDYMCGDKTAISRLEPKDPSDKAAEAAAKAAEAAEAKK